MSAQVAIRFLLGLRDSRGVLVPELHRASALDLFARSYESGAVYSGSGYWLGSPEPCMMLETIQPDGPTVRAGARTLARQLAQALAQECAGLVFAPVEFELVEPPEPRAWPAGASYTPEPVAEPSTDGGGA